MHTLSTPYCVSLLDFTQADASDVTSTLDQPSKTSTNTIEKLQEQFKTLPHLAGDIALELTLDSNLIECVVLYRGIVFVVTIDLQSTEHQTNKMEQAHRLGQQIKRHHKPSFGCFVVPVLLTFHAKPQGCDIVVSEQLVADTICDNGNHFAALIEHLSNQYKADQIIASEWLELTNS